ncbi:hypothetical protein WEI85_13705 [Actinomycetes bacterium KLBMP 9797]
MSVNQFQGDRVTLAKLISLASNLGAVHRSSDDRGAELGYTTYMMSAFGQARGGYDTVRRLGTR